MKTSTLSVMAGLVALSGWFGSLIPQQATRILGGFTHMRVFDTPGVDSFTIPAGVGRIKVEVRGAGGGGGSGNMGAAVGQGGSGGGYGMGIFSVSSGSVHQVIVGAGGLGAVNTCNVGLAGGTSSFGSLISATGGGGGGGCGTSSTPGTSTAQLNFDGQIGRQYFHPTGSPENPGGLCGDGTTVGMGGNGNAFFGRDGNDGNVVVFW